VAVEGVEAVEEAAFCSLAVALHCLLELVAELELQCYPDEAVIGVEEEVGAAEPHWVR